MQLVSASTKLRQMFYRQIEPRSFHGLDPFRTLNHREPSILMTFIASRCVRGYPAKDDTMLRQHQIATEDLRRCAHM